MCPPEQVAEAFRFIHRIPTRYPVWANTRRVAI